ncbi:hypothetical protein PsorP6_006794 [Peronosclerospora sorghi]|uniref:Uncharacterized protein n=1 Tax=Peronosclerospora sorghi TaxID=230839 RepID=A0ACC0W569_9STRA|nr:hypothetical protein PsorP6_006794 [Peronosclerospora sorghi]
MYAIGVPDNELLECRTDDREELRYSDSLDFFEYSEVGVGFGVAAVRTQTMTRSFDDTKSNTHIVAIEKLSLDDTQARHAPCDIILFLSCFSSLMKTRVMSKE